MAFTPNSKKPKGRKNLPQEAGRYQSQASKQASGRVPPKPKKKK